MKMSKTPVMIDLSHPIEEGTRVYPGMAKPFVNRLKQHDTHGVQVSKLEMVVHAGTHVDAPRHFLSDGATIEQVGLDKLSGEAILLDLTKLEPGDIIEKKHLVVFDGEVQAGDIVVLNTGYQYCPDVNQYCYMDIEAAQWLVDKGIKCLAGDIPSVDPVNKGPVTSTETHPCHHLLLGAGMPIVESLANLDKLTAKRFYFCCLPLNIVGSEGAPARAVAMELT